MAYLIGIDIGTSGTKTVLFDEAGTTIASALREYPMSQPANGWAEQDPELWWNAVCETLKQVTAGIDTSEIKGIGLSGQMHGSVLLDKNGNVLRPAILWCDQRTVAECEEITSIIGAQHLIELTANPALVGFTAPKVRWVYNHEPEIYAKIAKILLPKDYIRYKLSGEFATEVSDASGMLYLDVVNRCWSNEVLEKLDVDKNWLAPVYESPVISSVVNAEAAALTGLKAGTPIAGGAGDQAAGAVGNGIVREGVVSATIGTSGTIFAHTDTVKVHPSGVIQSFCHAVPGAWHLMGCTQGAGMSLQWFRNNFCGPEMDTAKIMGVDPYYLMDQAAAKVQAGCEGLIYLPYPIGERTPHCDADARGVFFGINPQHTRAHFTRAILEGVAFSLRDSLEILRDFGISTSEVRATGGGGKSKIWRKIQADVYNAPITTVQSCEGGALGVGILAAVGTALYSSVPEACDAIIRTNEPLAPDAEQAKIYDGYFRLYDRLYQALKPEYKELTKLYY